VALAQAIAGAGVGIAPEGDDVEDGEIARVEAVGEDAGRPPRSLFHGKPTDLVPAERHLASQRGLMPGQGPEKSRLSRAVRADQGGEVAWPELEVDAGGERPLDSRPPADGEVSRGQEGGTRAEARHCAPPRSPEPRRKRLRMIGAPMRARRGLIGRTEPPPGAWDARSAARAKTDPRRAAPGRRTAWSLERKA